MDPLKGSADHFKIFLPLTHDDLKAQAPSSDASSPAQPRNEADTVAGSWSSDLISMMDDLKSLSGKQPTESMAAGNHSWGIDPFSIYPAAGGGIFAPAMRGAWGDEFSQYSNPDRKSVEAPIDLSTPPAFLAENKRNESREAAGTNNSADRQTTQSMSPDSAYAQALRETARREVCASIPVIFDKLWGSEITKKEAIAQLGELSRKSDLSGDPMTRMLIKHFLNDISMGRTADSRSKNGSGQASDAETAPVDQTITANIDPSLYVKYFGGDGGCFCKPLLLAKGDDLARYLQNVQQSTAQGPIDHNTLKAMILLAKEFKGRSSLEDISNKGSTISFDEVSRGSLYLVNRWWNNGQIEICSEGKPVKPGEVDLGKLLTGSAPAVTGSTIELGDLRPKALDTSALGYAKLIMEQGAKKEYAARAPETAADLSMRFKSMASSFSSDKTDKAGLECREAAEKSPDLASEALGIYLDEMRPSSNTKTWSMSSFDVNRLLGQVKDKPWLKSLIMNHMDRLEDFTAEAQAKGVLADDNARNLIRLYDGIARGIPEAVDGPFMEKSVAPLLLCPYKETAGSSRKDAIKLVRDIWKTKPELAKPTIDAILKDRENLNLDDGVWDLIVLGAKKYGWNPGKEQLDQMAARLSHFSPASAATLFDYGTRDKDFVGALGVLRVLKDRNPSILKGFEIPDHKGALSSPERGLVDRVLSDPKSRQYLGSLFINDDKKDRFNFMCDLYPFISGNSEVRADLSTIMKDEYARAGSLDAISDRGRVALALLSHMGPEKWHAADVRAVLSKELLKKQPDKDLDRIAGYGRDDETQRLLDGISGGKLGTDEAMRSADRIVSLGFSAINTDVALNPWLGKLREAMKAVSADPAFITRRDAMMREVESSSSSAGSPGDMPVEDIRMLYLLMVLAGGDDALMSRIDVIMKPVMKADRGISFTRTAHQAEQYAALNEYKRTLIEKNIELLKTGNLPPMERMVLDEENDRNKLGFDTYIERNFDDATRDALLEGAARDYRSPEMDRFMDYFNDKGQTRWALSVLSRMAENGGEMPGEARRLLSILDAMPDKKEPEVKGFSSSVNEDGEEITTPMVMQEKKMKKDLSEGLKEYLSQKMDEVWKSYGNGPMTRSGRTALVKKSKGCYTSLHYGSPSQEIMQKTYSAFAKSISGADPSTGLSDLPDHFSDPQNACRIYVSLAPGAERDEEIGPEWQKFKGILTAMGGEQNLDKAIEAYGFAKKKENEGIPWDTVTSHIYRNSSIGADYREAPIREDGDVLAAAGSVEEFDNEIFIDGLRLDRK